MEESEEEVVRGGGGGGGGEVRKKWGGGGGGRVSEGEVREGNRVKEGMECIGEVKTSSMSSGSLTKMKCSTTSLIRTSVIRTLQLTKYPKSNSSTCKHEKFVGHVHSLVLHNTLFYCVQLSELFSHPSTP